MGKTVQALALAASLLLAGALFLFALSAVIGAAALGVVALFAAYAVAPRDTRTLLESTAQLVRRTAEAVEEIVREAAALMRASAAGTKAACATGESHAKKSAPESAEKGHGEERRE